MKKVYSAKRTDPVSFAVITAAFFFACFAALYMPSKAAEGFRSGMDYSLNVLLPSLFPFMFLSAFASEYGISAQLGRLLAPITRTLFCLPEEAGMTILLGLIGGFPVGAVGISSLLMQGKITDKQAQRMLCFCVNPGPAFMINAVGDGIYGSSVIGILLFCAQTAASLLIGIIIGIIAGRKEKIPVNNTITADAKDFSSAFVLSTRRACSSSVSLCSMVVLFSSFSTLAMAVLDIPTDSLEGTIIRAVLEVTDGCLCIAKEKYPLFVTAMCIGWGGVSVHFQIFSALERLNINKLQFILARLTVGAASAGIVYLICEHTDISIAVFAKTQELTAEFSSVTVSGSLALFISSILFVIFINKRETAAYNVMRK